MGRAGGVIVIKWPLSLKVRDLISHDDQVIFIPK